MREKVAKPTPARKCGARYNPVRCKVQLREIQWLNYLSELPDGLIQAGSLISIRPSSRRKNFLNHYATQLNTVEVNFTFRQLVKETTIQNWIEQTPAHFRFGIKAHQVITHIKRLKGTEEFLPRFLATIEPLASAGKLGPVLFQLPPNLKADAALLKDFLALLPRTLAGGV